MASATATLTPSPAVVPTDSPTAALTLANVLYEKKNAIAYVTVNRPKVLNALNTPTWKDLQTAFEHARDDVTVRGIILTGAGDRAFSAGADIHEMAGLSSEELAKRSDTRGRISWHIANYSKPLIGAINGLAYGGAALLSSSLDLRIGCEKTQFRFLAASYGRVNSTWSLPALVGIPKAKELLYTGRMVAAEEAERVQHAGRHESDQEEREVAPLRFLPHEQDGDAEREQDPADHS